MDIRVDNWRTAWIQANDIILKSSMGGVVFQDGVRCGIRILNVISISQNNLNGMTLQDVGYTDKKETHLIRSYIDEDDFQKGMAQLVERLEKGDRVFNIGIHFKKDGKPNSTTGPCLLAMTLTADWPHVDFYFFFRSNELVRRFYADCIFLHDIIKRIEGVTKKIKKDIAIMEENSINIISPWMYVSGTYGPLLDLFEPFSTNLKTGVYPRSKLCEKILSNLEKFYYGKMESKFSPEKAIIKFWRSRHPNKSRGKSLV